MGSWSLCLGPPEADLETGIKEIKACVGDDAREHQKGGEEVRQRRKTASKKNNINQINHCG